MWRAPEATAPGPASGSRNLAALSHLKATMTVAGSPLMPRARAGLDHPELELPEVRKLWQTEGLFSDHYLKAQALISSD